MHASPDGAPPPLRSFVAAATQVPFTASNVIIKFAERCLAKCQERREDERGARSRLVIFNALNEKVCELFFWSNVVGETAVACRGGVGGSSCVRVKRPVF